MWLLEIFRLHIWLALVAQTVFLLGGGADLEDALNHISSQ